MAWSIGGKGWLKSSEKFRDVRRLRIAVSLSPSSKVPMFAFGTGSPVFGLLAKFGKSAIANSCARAVRLVLALDAGAVTFIAATSGAIGLTNGDRSAVDALVVSGVIFITAS